MKKSARRPPLRTPVREGIRGMMDRRDIPRTAVFAADLMPTTAHVDDPWIMGYDLYPMDTLAFKRTFVREAIAREYLIFFEHEPEIAAGYIRETNGRRHVEAVLRT